MGEGAGHRRRRDTDPHAGPADPADPDERIGRHRQAGGSTAVGEDLHSTAEVEPSPEPTAPSQADADQPADEQPADQAQARPGAKRGRRRKRSLWRELPILVAVALVLAVVIKTYALQAFFIPSGSMENTLEVNDRVLINKLTYDFRGIHRGDIVVFNGDGTWNPGTIPGGSDFFAEFADGFASMFGFGHKSAIYVKRVIGLPHDHVACCDAQGRVTVNNVPLNESSYLFPGNVPSEVRFNITVPDGHLWVMGDHRKVSEDSRFNLGKPGGGSIPASAVLGRAFIIIWPPGRWRILPVPATLQQPAMNNTVAADPAAHLLGARLEPAGPGLPLALGFAGALPLTWAQRRYRRARKS